MGNSQEATKTHLVIIYDKFTTEVESAEWMETLTGTPNLTYDIFPSISEVFQTQSQDNLQNILTSLDMKDEVIRYMLKHHLASARLYVLAKKSEIVSQEDFDNVYVTYISSDLTRIIKHVQMSISNQVYMPLLKLNREMQKKINVKVVCCEEDQPQLMRQLLQKRLSCEAYPNPRLFQDSILTSVSDYIVCEDTMMDQMLQIVKYRLKSAKIICYQKSESPYQQEEDIIRFSSRNFQDIIDKISSDNKMIGYRLQPFSTVYLMIHQPKYDDSVPAVPKNRDGLIKTIIEDKQNSKLRFEICYNPEELSKHLEFQPYAVTIFLEGKSMMNNEFKKLLIKKNMDHKVLSIVLKSQSYPQKYKEFCGLSKYYYFENRPAKTVDWINKRIKSQFFDIHKKQLLIHNLRSIEFESLDEYMEKCRSGTHIMSPFIICSANSLDKVERFIEERSRITKRKSLVVCFDKRQNILNVKKQRVFKKNDHYLMSSYNIKEIIEGVKKYQIEYLVITNVRSKAQLKAYEDVREYYKSLKSLRTKGFRVETSAFRTMEYQALYKEEVSFLGLYDTLFGFARVDSFIENFVNIWTMKYNPLKDFEMLRSDLRKLMVFCLQCEVLRVRDRDFEIEYTKKIDSSQTLRELSQVCIYIYSLPHGFSQLLNRLLYEFQDNIRLLRMFSPFFFCILMNFCNFFEHDHTGNKNLKIYLDGEVDQSLFKVGTPLYNISFFNCINDDEYEETSKNFITIEYSYLPLKQRSFFCSLLYIEPYSFYKEAVEYIFAPYTKFMVKEIRKKGNYKQVVLKCEEKTGIVNYFVSKSIGNNSVLQAITDIMNDERYRKTLVPEQEYEDRMSFIYYQEFLNALQKGQFHTARFKFNQCLRKNNEDVGDKMMKNVEETWLTICQGEYGRAEKMIQTLLQTSQDEQQLKQLLVLIEDIKKKRWNIIRSSAPIMRWQLNHKSKQGWYLDRKPMKWSCRYVAEEEEFTISNKGSTFQFMINRERLKYGSKLDQQSINVSDKVFIEVNTKMKRIVEEYLELDRDSKKVAAEALLIADEINVEEHTDHLLAERQRKSLLAMAKGENQKTLLQRKNTYDVLSSLVENDEGRQTIELPHITKTERLLESVEEEQESKPMKWVCMYLDGQFKMSNHKAEKKRLKVKKYKKPHSNFQI